MGLKPYLKVIRIKRLIELILLTIKIISYSKEAIGMFKGSAVAIVTPFRDDQLDLDAFSELIAIHLKNKTQALIVLGTTGEAATQTYEERAIVIQRAVQEVRGRIPVIVGTGSNDTKTAIQFSQQAEELGADGLLLVTPYYNKCTQNGLIQHVSMVAKATSLPIILYNVPPRTGVNIDPKTVAILAEIENVIGIKEASGDISQILEMKRLLPETFKVYSGNDDQIIPIYACGGDGVISVAANVIPHKIQIMCEAFMDGNREKALQLQLKYKRFFDLLFMEVNPIPVKASLHMMGNIENNLRLPLTPMEKDNYNILREELHKLEILS